MRRFMQFAAIFLVFSTAAQASGPGERHTDGLAFLEGGILTYDLFETAVAHVDLEGCPAQFDPDVVFCRMALNHDQAHIFIFAHEGDQPLLGIKSYDLDEGFLPF